ncbi:MAG: hypothetical protein ACSLEW_07975 [Nocardioides sp.]
MKVGYLIMGVVFLTAVGCWALVQTDVVSTDDRAWLLPVPWVLGVGVGLIVMGAVSMGGSRGPGTTDAQTPPQASPGDPTTHSQPSDT